MDKKSEYNIIVKDTVTSTNSVLKEMAKDGCRKKTVLIANCQTQGRGRLGRSFYSPPDSGLYISLLLPYNSDSEYHVTLTAAAAVAVRRAIKSTVNIDTKIKWVNDLYVGDKKVCGILAEGALCKNELRYAAVGVGLNYQSPVFTGGLSSKAGSLYPDSQPPVSIDEMAAAMADQLYKALTNPSDPSIYREYRASSMLTGKRVVLMREGEPDATAIDVTPEGHLVVRFDDGRTEELYSGEVSVRAAEYPHTV